MDDSKWQALRDWLYRMFPADEAEELFQAHIDEAKGEDIYVPVERPEPTGTWIKW